MVKYMLFIFYHIKKGKIRKEENVSEKLENIWWQM
jgi:hypothetical protein